MSRIAVTLPPRFDLGSIHSFLGQVIDEIGLPRADQIIFDFSRLAFIDGSGITALCNAIEWLEGTRTYVGFAGFGHHGEAVRYLDDCGFFEVYAGEKLRQGTVPRVTTLPVRKVIHQNSHAWLEFNAGPWIASKLHTTPAKLQTVKSCMKEMFNNIHEHSTKDAGFIHIQHYPKVARLDITISDFGREIPAVMRTKFPALVNDSQAILSATKEGVSTKGGGFCGQGLDLLVQYVVIRNRGTVAIYSGKGGLHCSSNANTVRKTAWMGTGRFPGTLVDIRFNTNGTLLDEEEEEDLEW